MFEILLAKSARRFYERAAPPLQRKLDRCFERLEREPAQGPNIRSLTGELKGYLRYRVGDHRVVYRLDASGRVVIVVVIAHRSSVY